MTKVLVGSKNASKLRAVKKAFRLYFSEVEVEGFSVLSKVPPQPWEEDVLRGAQNRALAVERINRGRELGAQYFVGIESGVLTIHSLPFLSGCVHILDTEGRGGWGMAPAFQVPTFFLQHLKEGRELGELMERFFGQVDSRRQQGAIGILTRGQIRRSELYYSATVMALIPFLSPEIYSEADD